MKGERAKSNNKTKDQVKRQKEYEKTYKQEERHTAQVGKCYRKQLSGMLRFRTRASTLGA